MTTTPHLPAGLDRELMAMRLAAALRDVDARYVNLGIGLPTLVSNFIPAVADVILHAENGMLNYGPLADLHEQDVDYRNAGGQFITLLPGAAFMDSSLSFALIRSGRLDVTILGGYQVSGNGDLANWMRPVRGIGSIGGAMDLVYGTKQVFVGMEHTTRTGEPRIVSECTYPITGRRCVNLIVTNLAVIDVTASGLVLREVAPGVDVDEVIALTGAPLQVSPDVTEFQF